MASRERDKPSAELLRRSLATAARAEDACPEPEILAAYSEHALAADETARYDLHFSSCPRCREQLAAMARASGLAVTGDEKRARAPRAAWNWDWRWLAPATAALLVVAIVVVFRPVHRPAEQPLVAMSQPSQPPTASGTAEFAPAARDAVPSEPPAKSAISRTAPNLNSAQSEFAPPPASPALEKKEDLEASNGVALRTRESTRSDKLASTAATPKVDASRKPAYTCPPGVICDVMPSVSDVPPDTTSSAPVLRPPAKSAPPPPPVIAAPISQGITDSTTADAGVSSVGTESARSKQVPAPALVNRATTLSQSVVMEAAADPYAQTLVRSPDPQVLWRVSGGRVVERSSDAGATWREQWTNASARIVAGAAPSADTCWLVGRGGVVLLTTDGKAWKAIAPPAAADFVSVSVDGVSSATLTASDGRQFTTSDGGKRWTPAP